MGALRWLRGRAAPDRAENHAPHRLGEDDIEQEGRDEVTAQGGGVRLAIMLLALAASTLAVGSTSAAADPGACPNAAVRAQQRVAYLPNCRAFEIVNPAGNDFGDVSRVVQIGEEGDRVAYLTASPGEGVASVFLDAMLVGERTAGGWAQHDADMVPARPVDPLGLWTPTVFSADLGQALISTYVSGDPGDEGMNLDLYRVPVDGGRAVRLTPGVPEDPTVVGASADAGRVVWAQLGYEEGLWTTTDGTDLERVSVLPDGSPANLGGSLASRDTARGYAPAPASNLNLAPHGGAHTVSVDGRRVFFSALDPGGSGAGSLYMRDLVAGESVPVVVSQRSGEAGPRPASGARFVSATPDGRVVYFLCSEQLTDTATAGGGIYRYDLVDGDLKLVTPDTGGPPLELLAGLLSEDGSRLYFSSSDALLPGAVSGASNVYVSGGAGGTRLVAAEGELSRISRDGRFAVLQSRAPLGGAPTAGHEAVFEYDDASGGLACVSCRPGGAPSQGDSFVDRQAGVPLIPLLAGPRGVADDGAVFFTSSDQLVAEDEGPAFDAYMYDAGRPSLLSGGGDQDAFVAESSDDGDDVFVVTRAPLVEADRDADDLDVYDIRVDGGFLEPSPAPECAEGCRTGGSSGADMPPPATATFVGPGNRHVARNRHRPRRKHRHRGGHRKRTGRAGVDRGRSGR